MKILLSLRCCIQKLNRYLFRCDLPTLRTDLDVGSENPVTTMVTGQTVDKVPKGALFFSKKCEKGVEIWYN